MVSLATVPWLEVKRCEGCGLLWEFPDRGATRVTLAHVRATYPDAPAIPRRAVRAAPPSPVRRVRTQMNQGALFRIVITTDTETWCVRSRGSLTSERCETGESVELAADDAVALAGRAWGVDAAGALRLAVATGFDDAALHALDVVQGFARTDWEHPWQPGTAEIVDAMLVADPRNRVRVAAQLGQSRGIPREDLELVGLVP